MNERTLRQVQRVGSDLCVLWVEAAWVVWLRAQALARGGPEAAAEARLMVGEKVAAQQELVGKLAAGELGATPLAVTANVTRHVLKGVRANRRRLSRR